MPKIKIKNLSAEINRRIRLIKTPTSVVEVGEQNGAVVESADYVGICLAPLQVPVISCDELMVVPDFQYNVNGVNENTEENKVLWQIEVDGILYEQKLGWIGYTPDTYVFLEEFLQGNPELGLQGLFVEDDADFGSTYILIKNLKQVSRSIRLIPDKLIQVNTMSFVNDSVVVDDATGIISFDLCASSSTPIGCAGATTEIYFPYIGGEWNIELDGVLYETHGASIGYFIRSTFSDILDCFDDGFMRLVNKDFLPHRIKFIPVQDTGYTAPEDNPTFIAHPDGSLTFCLAEKGIPLGCEGATSVLNFERLIGGNYSFGAVDEENNRYEYVAGTVDDIRTWLDNNSFVELTLNNDGFGHFTYTGTTYKKFYIIMLNDGEMSIPTDNPTVTHIVGEQGYQWCAFSSVEPPWDVEYILNGENFRELTGDPIPFDYMTSSQATELTINNTITTIQNRAFAFWLNAKKLYLPDSLTTVSHDVFKDWNSLIEIKIPNSVKTIGISCFTNAQSATIVDIGNSVESIGDNSFNNLYSCQKIILRSQTPPALGNASVFSGIPPSCLFYVPVGCIDAYVSSGQFGDGSLIREIQD